MPFWDSRDEFGDTNLLVLKPEEGRSLAKALGPYWLVLMRRHGATVAAKNLTELVFRTIYTTRNAELQLMCKAQGHALSPLTKGEAKMAWDRNLQPPSLQPSRQPHAASAQPAARSASSRDIS